MDLRNYLDEIEQKKQEKKAALAAQKETEEKQKSKFMRGYSSHMKQVIGPGIKGVKQVLESFWLLLTRK